ncbi:hypothetical protein PhCBS80983_g02839 [Powellomyces hirtus]|uniref:Xylanolytic transcriptional activator regulatory domain-containing protein n=1 Tax=Powellomyces hirtus TaxID=109895 RepID=A0A507E712_9FUNG|nr:hypothetical protein PhCBS80983_g02839 [Powellomyces hirtus]
MSTKRSEDCPRAAAPTALGVAYPGSAPGAEDVLLQMPYLQGDGSTDAYGVQSSPADAPQFENIPMSFADPVDFSMYLSDENAVGGSVAASSGLNSAGSAAESEWSLFSGNLPENKMVTTSQDKEVMTRLQNGTLFQYSTLELEPASWRAQELICSVVSQLLVSESNLASDNASIFSDLPMLPDAMTLCEILALYFEKIPCIISIIHEAFFYKLASQPPAPPPPFPFPSTTSPPGINAALLFSMFACAARFHPMFLDKRADVEKIFYERARRLTLRMLDKPDMNTLKTLCHLTLFGVENSLWTASYTWLGASVTLARFLGLYKDAAAIAFGGSDAQTEELIGGLSPQQIATEECRRIWWWIRNYDASGSAASKRPQMISDSEYEVSLLLPCPDSLFYATRYGCYPESPAIPRTETLNEFFDARGSVKQMQSMIGPNGYVAALATLFNRVTTYRQQCNNRNILPFAPVSPGDDVDELVQQFSVHERELDTWYKRLPEWVKVLDSGLKNPKDPLVAGGLCWNEQWVRETYEWCIALVIWHASAATLHGPEYNMMAIGNQIVTGAAGAAKASHIAQDFLSAARLDEVLRIWQDSSSFGIALEHASRASGVIEQMVYNVAPNKRRDTPFFGYCVCQLGLVNLIAARQLTLLRAFQPSVQDDPNSLSSTLKHRASMSIHILDHQSKRFTASKSGMDLLHKVMTEIAGGDITMKVLDELARKGAAGAEGSGGFKEVLVRKAMSESVKKVMEEPSICAGTMAMGGHKFGGR